MVRAVGQLGGGDRRVAELAQPGFGKLHGTRAQLNCARKRRVVREEEAQVVDAVAQHGQPVRPHAEGEADVALGVEPEVAHHVRVHLAGAGHLQPAAGQRPAGERMSISALGSVNGKNGAEAQPSSSVSKKRRQKSVKTTFRSLKLTFSPIHRPSHWWNIGECVASLSTR